MKQDVIDALNEEVCNLHEWADSSRAGGWSTHLVDPMIDEAVKLDTLLWNDQSRDVVLKTAIDLAAKYREWVRYTEAGSWSSNNNEALLRQATKLEALVGRESYCRSTSR